MWTANLLGALLHWVLFASLPLAATAAPDELEQRRGEVALLHRSVDLSTLQVWAPERKAWQPARGIAAPVSVVHFWAIECAPCVRELPVWRDIVLAAQRSPLAQKIAFVFITETYDDESLSQFLQTKSDEFPPVGIYRSKESDRRLRNAIQTDKLPVTLLVDQRSAIRHALLGPIADRRGEFVSALTRLIALRSSK